MKQAILIIAHNNIEQLKILLSLLDNINFSIFIHIDKKCSFDINDIKSSCNLSDVFIYSEYDVKWASFSIALCEILLLEEALNTDCFEYFHLISGLDLPLKSSDEIYSFFHLQKKEFVHIESKKIKKSKLDLLKYYYPMINFKKFRQSKILKGINLILVKTQKLLKIDRTKNCSVEFFTGAQWFSITNDFAKYLISRKDFIKKHYKYTRNSDEIFVQTELMNSHFKDCLFYNKMDNNYIACMRFIDWSRGKPYTWRASDFDELINSDYLFARKFDCNIDNEIIFKIADYINNK